MKNFLKKTLAVFLLSTVVFGSAPLPRTPLFGLTPQPVIEIGPSQGYLAAIAASNAVIAAETTTLTIKETVLDAIAFALINGIIAAFSQSIVD